VVGVIEQPVRRMIEKRALASPSMDESFRGVLVLAGVPVRFRAQNIRWRRSVRRGSWNRAAARQSSGHGKAPAIHARGTWTLSLWLRPPFVYSGFWRDRASPHAGSPVAGHCGFGANRKERRSMNRKCHGVMRVLVFAIAAAMGAAPAIADKPNGPAAGKAGITVRRVRPTRAGTSPQPAPERGGSPA